MTSAAVTRALSTFHGFRGASWNATCAGTTPRSIGKSGGENVRAIESSRLSTVDGGPQTSSTTFLSHIGPKKRSPST